MRKAAIITTVFVLITLVPTVEAAWTSSVSVPASFRPSRTVTLSYTASSSSATDLPLQWRVTLSTCQDLDADTWCESTDANRVDHGERTLSIVGGGTQTVTWDVNLNSAEGAYRYHFHTTCTNNPCAGVAAGGAHNRTGAFQLAYTNTWTRTILATTPTSVGSTQTIQYRLQSTSMDDRDLTGVAQLYSSPPGQAERDHGARSISVLANQQQTLSWTGVTFPEIGMQRLRVTDTTGPASMMDVTVRGVHLHATQPRVQYEAGGTFGLYFTLEGHGSTPDPVPIANNDVRLSVKNGSFVVASATLRTDANGLAYANVTTADDLEALTWTATASGSWLGIAFDLSQSGIVTLTPSGHAGLGEDLTSIQQDLDEVQLKGVHLDEIGSRNAWMTSIRAAGAVLLVVLLILLVIVMTLRM